MPFSRYKTYHRPQNVVLNTEAGLSKKQTQVYMLHNWGGGVVKREGISKVSDIIYLGGDVDRWARESGRADNITLLRLLRLPCRFLSEGDRLTASSGSEMTLQSSLTAPAAELSDDPVRGRS